VKHLISVALAKHRNSTITVCYVTVSKFMRALIVHNLRCHRIVSLIHHSH
jgi:hypothetical protein